MFPEQCLPYTTHEQTEWDTIRFLSKEGIDRVWQEVMQSRSFWAALPALVQPEVFDDINRRARKHYIAWVTTRPGKEVHSQTWTWLRAHGIEQPHVILSKKKGDIARALDADFFLDDKVENASCIHWIADSKPCRSYIIDRPYNQSNFLPKKVKRIKTIEEFLNDIS